MRIFRLIEQQVREIRTGCALRLYRPAVGRQVAVFAIQTVRLQQCSRCFNEVFVRRWF